MQPGTGSLNGSVQNRVSLTAVRKAFTASCFPGEGLSVESTFEITLKNAKDEAVTVTVVEPVPGDWRVLTESQKHRKGAANAAVWAVPVPAKGETTLTYRVEVSYSGALTSTTTESPETW